MSEGCAVAGEELTLSLAIGFERLECADRNHNQRYRNNHACILDRASSDARKLRRQQEARKPADQADPSKYSHNHRPAALPSVVTEEQLLEAMQELGPFAPEDKRASGSNSKSDLGAPKEK
jgi:hypothetical protein